MNETLAGRALDQLGMTAGEAALVTVIVIIATAVMMGHERRIAAFAAIGGVIALLISASA